MNRHIRKSLELLSSNVTLFSLKRLVRCVCVDLYLTVSAGRNVLFPKYNSVYVYVCAGVGVCVRVCERECVKVCVCMCACVCVDWWYVCMHTIDKTHRLACIVTLIPAPPPFPPFSFSFSLHCPQKIDANQKDFFR